MQFGVVFPQTEISADPADVRAFTQAVDEMGFDYVMAYDHVLGANPEREGGWTGPYTHETQFHEIFTLFAYMSAISERLSYISGILILPQRQTALVAKQAAQIDVFSGGKLRVGVGVGWNAVEMSGLGEDFHTRGKRIEEQVDVLRLLWTQRLVTFEGQQHKLDDVGLKPMPIQQPIPVWFGGGADVVLRRIARMADGWIPNGMPLDQAQDQVSRVKRYMEAEGRDVSAFGMDVRVNSARHSADEQLEHFKAWRGWGATHFALDTMRAGYTSLQQHLDAAQDFLKRMQDAL